MRQQQTLRMPSSALDPSIPEMLDTDIVIHAIIGGKLDKNGKGDIKCQLTIQCSGKIFCIGNSNTTLVRSGIILPMVNRAEAL